jgi:hypothetical protein
VFLSGLYSRCGSASEHCRADGHWPLARLSCRSKESRPRTLEPAQKIARPQLAAKVHGAVATQTHHRDVLDTGLPRAYDKSLYEQKCSALFKHIYESYPECDAGVYAEAS